MRFLIKLFARFTALTFAPTDSGTVKNHKFSLLVMSLVMSVGAIAWGVVAAVTGHIWQSFIPWTYILISVFNIGYLIGTKKLDTPRNIQMFFSVLLPFAFQWAMGGFIKTGGVSLWAMLAVSGQFTLNPLNRTYRWFFLFIALVIMTWLSEITFPESLPQVSSAQIGQVIFVLNISLVCGCLFVITQYFVKQEERFKFNFYSQVKAINANMASLELDLHKSILKANEKFLDMFGYTEQEVIGQDYCLKIHGNPVNGPSAQWHRLVNGEGLQGEFLTQKADGTPIWFYAAFTPVLNQDNEVVKILVIKTDITKQKQQETELKRLSLVASEVSNAVVITNAAGKTEWVNPAFTTLTGYLPNEIIGHKPGELLQGPQTLPETIEEIRRGLAIGAPFYVELVNYHKQGLPYWTNLQITPIRNEAGQIEQFISVQADISERKNSEERIKTAYEELLSQKEILEEMNNLMEELNYTLEAKTAKLEDQQKTLVLQADIMEKQARDLTDSITYAKRIQEAILVPVEEFKYCLEDCFVMYRPKNIVSGDFYWLAEKVSDQSHKIIIAIADCTGHGVPGAFMSLIGNALLNQVVHDREVHEPGRILDELNIGITKALRQLDTSNKDGMDIAVLVIDKATQKATFAGAKRPLIHIHKGELHYLKGNMMPIGAIQYYAKLKNKRFDQFSFDIAPGDVFYMMSDGYEDQFGGSDATKFMSKRLRELLFSLHNQDFAQQKAELVRVFDEWKGTNAQIDDVLVLGFKL